jgi:MoaA/NifB/PqqE/SkfB family radical SAM enzyme
MIDWSLLRFLKPAKIWAGLRRRGMRQGALHGARKVGTALNHALAGPSSLRINPMGFICNHRCPMCWLQHFDPADFERQQRIDRELGLKLADYERLFDSMPPGLEEVNLVGGGEPLVHAQCLEIMAAVKRRGWRGSLITNGSLLREAAAQHLVEIGWDEVRVSVHAGDAETYRLIQGVDHYETTRRNLIDYTRLRTTPAGRRGHLGVFHVLQHENIPSIDKLFAFAEDVGADSLEFEKIIPLDAAKALSAAELQRAREAVQACARDSKVPCNIDTLLPTLMREEQAVTGAQPWVPARRCSVGFDQSFINAVGQVFPCCFSNEEMGNVRETSFRDIWFGSRYAAFRARLNRGRFAKYCIDTRCAMKGVLHQ